MIEQAISHYVLPIVKLKNQSNVKDYVFLGTCFLIKNNTIAITCKHIVENRDDLHVLIFKDNQWIPTKIIDIIVHDEEDIAIVTLENKNILPTDSFFEISSRHENSSCNYIQWSYPEDVVTELIENGKVSLRPDLIYFQGYIRRRINNKDLIPSIKSISLYELSEFCIYGCSGSPIIDRNSIGQSMWKVIGIYCANKTTEFAGDKILLGYAVRTDAIYEWIKNNSNI